MSLRVGVCVCLGVVFTAGSIAWAGGVCQTANVVQSNALVQSSSLTVVPFAIPVAVPVATVANPAVLYSYQQQAGVNVSSSSATTIKPAAPVSTDPVAILQRHCVECHRGDGAQGHLSLFGNDGKLLEKLPRHVIADQVIPDEQGQSAMPPVGRPRLTTDEVRSLRRWATQARDVVF